MKLRLLPQFLLTHLPGRAMALLLCVLFFWISSKVLSAQNISFINYNVDSGLPSNEVYRIIEDQRGVMWFATDKGVCSYNGYKFKAFNTSHGLPDNTIFLLEEDNKNRIWLGSLSGKMSYIKNDSIVNILPKTNFGPITHMYIDQNDTLWLASSKHQFKVYQDENSAYTFDTLTEKCFVNRIDNTTNGSLLGNGIFYSEIPYRIKGANCIQKLEKDSSLYLNYSNPSVFNISKNETWVANGYQLLSVTKDGITPIFTFPKDRQYAFFKTKYNKYFLTSERGLHELSHDFSTKNKYLKNQRVTHIVQDREKGYWISTLSSGVFYTTNFKITTHSLNKEIKKFKILEDKLFAIDSFEGLYRIKKNSPPELQSQFDPKNVNLSYIIPTRIVGHKLRIYISINSVNLENIETGERRVISRFPYRRRYSKVIPYENLMLIPTIKGLYSFDTINYKAPVVNWGEKFPELNQRINEVFQDTDHSLWIATNKKGLYHLKNDSITHINTISPGLGAICRHVVCNENYIWAATENGLVKMDKFSFKIEQIILKKDGLLSNKINSLILYKDDLIVAHSNGVSWIPLEYQKETYPPLIYIEDIKINRKKTSLSPEYQLDNNTRNVQIIFSGVSYNSDLTYHYRMNSENDTNWSITKNRSVEFLSLSPGDYSFELFAVNHRGETSTSPIQIRFNIHPPFWQQIWFLLLSTTTVFLTAFLILKYRYHKQQKKIAAERNLLEVEQQALRARMNPHFIFNALNSVQLYIMENDKRKSNKYLISFSRLIRAIVDNSDKKLIPIESELKVLESYLKIEIIRFKEKIDYSFIIDPSIDLQNLLIPPMLLQPYIENAIFHGIVHLDKEGHISIQLVEQKEELICIIQDNGIGREASRKINAKRNISHNSVGLKITANRIELLRSIYNKNFSVNIIDLFEEDTPTGTKVELKIPKLNNTTVV